jgi:hypothetical protein
MQMESGNRGFQVNWRKENRQQETPCEKIRTRGQFSEMRREIPRRRQTQPE